MNDSPTSAPLALDPLQLQTIIDSSSDCIKVLDLDAHLLSMNAGGMEIMEVTDFSSCQFLLWPTFWEGDARLQVEQALQAAREGQTSTFEGPARTLAGTPKWWEVRVSPLRDTGGTITQLLAISRDVTARKTAEQQLQASELRLRERASTLEVQVSQNERALDAFVRFTTEVASSTDLTVLATAALDILRDVVSDAMSGFYLIRGDTAFPLIFSSNTPPKVQALQQGLSLQSPLVARAFRARGVAFVEQDQGLHPWMGQATALSVTPYVQSDHPYALLVTGTDRLSWTEQERAIIQSVGRGLGLALERAHQTQQLQERTAGLDAFVAFTEAVGTETDLLTLAQQAIAVLRGRFDDGSIGYYTPDGDLWKAQAWSEDMDEALIARLRAGLPSSTHFIRSALETGLPVFTDTWDPEREEIEDTEAYGAAAAYPLRVDGEVRHLLLCGLKGTQRWIERDRALVRAVGRSLALAFDRAEQTRQLEEERAALDAFAVFAETSAGATDVQALARRAIEVLRAVLGEVSVAYSDLDGALWKARVWSDDHTPEVVAVITAGIEVTAPSYAESLATQDAVFVAGWEATREGVAATEGYGAGAFYPCLVDGAPQGLLAMGTQQAGDWNPRERQVFRAVGRSLTLALERTEQARRLEAQNAELDARTRALEAFRELTRDLSVHHQPETLMEQALGLVLSLLPSGYAAFWQLEGQRWQATALVGDGGTSELQALIAAGVPAQHTPTLDLPFQTRTPLFQDVYNHAQDVAPKLVGHIHSVATLPVLVNEEVAGIFNVVLFRQRFWTPADRAVLETTVRSLGLALEGAQSVAQLAQRTQELERSNAELEQFAYIASHDLQAPIRAVTSFAGIIHKRYKDALDERGQLYLRQIVESGEHMKRLVDDLLAFSRVHTEQRPFLPTEAELVFDGVARRLQGEVPGATLTRSKLPVVQADAQQLDQLLQNLIANGLKYRREDVPPEVSVSAQREGKFWRFAVADNGIGIEPQYFERIFEIFQRLHGRDSYEGTGIGLAVCKKIVERHGGRLWLESTFGQGSTFLFTLPGLEP